MTAYAHPVNARRLTVRLARDAADLDAVQHLRWRVFFEEMGAQGDPALAALHCDADPYDALCDHLLVVDESLPEGADALVGTYRLLRESVARAHSGFYSAGEYDLAPLLADGAQQRELLELCLLYTSRCV